MAGGHRLPPCFIKLSILSKSGFGYLTIARIASFEAGEYRTPWYKT
jgi:hypothetical protein